MYVFYKTRYNASWTGGYNVAIGGFWGGQRGIDEELREAVMEVDYVRVYRRR